MVWTRINPKNDKPMYLKRFGNMYVLSYDKKGAVDEVPEGWDTVIVNGNLKLKRDK